MDETKIKEILSAFWFDGATPADLRRRFGDDALAHLIDNGYLERSVMSLQETSSPEGARLGSGSVETLVPTDRGKKVLGIE